MVKFIHTLSAVALAGFVLARPDGHTPVEPETGMEEVVPTQGSEVVISMPFEEEQPEDGEPEEEVMSDTEPEEEEVESPEDEVESPEDEVEEEQAETPEGETEEEAETPEGEPESSMTPSASTPEGEPEAGSSPSDSYAVSGSMPEGEPEATPEGEPESVMSPSGSHHSEDHTPAEWTEEDEEQLEQLTDMIMHHAHNQAIQFFTSWKHHYAQEVMHDVHEQYQDMWMTHIHEQRNKMVMDEDNVHMLFTIFLESASHMKSQEFKIAFVDFYLNYLKQTNKMVVKQGRMDLRAWEMEKHHGHGAYWGNFITSMVSQHMGEYDDCDKKGMRQREDQDHRPNGRPDQHGPRPDGPRPENGRPESGRPNGGRPDQERDERPRPNGNRPESGRPRDQGQEGFEGYEDYEGEAMHELVHGMYNYMDQEWINNIWGDI